MGGAQGRLGIVGPSRHPVPLAGGIPVIEAHLNNRPGWSGLLKSGEDTVYTILVGFDFDDHVRSWMRVMLLL
jgi:hypothetical protein